FLLCLSLLFFSKAMSGSYMKSSITSIERHFDLPSSVAGIIDGGFEMGNLLVITAVSYFGARFHRPRIIAAGATLMGLGTLLIALPHFLMGRVKAREIKTNFESSDGSCLSASGCVVRVSPPGCQHKAQSSLWVLILVGNALRGIGESPITPLGISFLDDHARADNSAFYLGCVMTVGLIGPAVGFLVGSVCTKLFVDVGNLVLTQSDSRWVGAWWLGFLIAGGITLLTALPLWFFPASVPHEEELATAAAVVATVVDGNTVQDSAKNKHKLHRPTSPGSLFASVDFLPSLRCLMANPVYVCMLINYVMLMNAFMGFFTFKAKYLEEQFGETASRSNLIIGAA
uniref:Solute carrier organic anion transporter family member n=1 Tax=Petromyzon marinus TaxID=7757 RepID=S4RKF5_PETMA